MMSAHSGALTETWGSATPTRLSRRPFSKRKQKSTAPCDRLSPVQSCSAQHGAAKHFSKKKKKKKKKTSQTTTCIATAWLTFLANFQFVGCRTRIHRRLSLRPPRAARTEGAGSTSLAVCRIETAELSSSQYAALDDDDDDIQQNVEHHPLLLNSSGNQARPFVPVQRGPSPSLDSGKIGISG